MNKVVTWARKAAYWTIGAWGGKERENKIVVLCYHAISSDSWEYSIDKEKFTQQIKRLLLDYYFIEPDELLAYLSGERLPYTPAILLTFDDGYGDVLAVKDFLRMVGIKPLLFVLAQREGVDRRELDTARPLLTMGQIKTLLKSGWTIGCHGDSHRSFERISGEEIRREVGEAKKHLEKKLGDYRINYFAYPKGVYSTRIIEEVKRTGYKAAFSMDDGHIGPETDRFTIPRIGVNDSHGLWEVEAMLLDGAIDLRLAVKNVWPGVMT